MKENYTQLYPNEQTATAVGDYSFEHSTKLPKHITEHHLWGTETQKKANYMISPFQCQFQVWMAKALGAKRILEIGTFIGFSTLGWASAVGEDGHVTTLEFVPEFAKVAEGAWAKHGVKNIECLVGDASESMQTLVKELTKPYDLIFIDADKQSYPKYLSLILSLSPPGPNTSTRLLKECGIIIADNILRRALVADASDNNPWAAKARHEGTWEDGDIKALDEFNKAFANDKRLETFLMPMFDGLGMGRLVD